MNRLMDISLVKAFKGFYSYGSNRLSNQPQAAGGHGCFVFKTTEINDGSSGFLVVIHWFTTQETGNRFHSKNSISKQSNKPKPLAQYSVIGFVCNLRIKRN